MRTSARPHYAKRELRHLLERLSPRVAKRVVQRRILGRTFYWPPETPLLLWAESTTIVDLLTIKGFGRRAREDVERALRDFGIRLPITRSLRFD